MLLLRHVGRLRFALGLTTILVLAAATLTSASSAGSASAAKPPLTNSTRPLIEGTGWSEDPLTLTLGDWSDEPDSVSVYWRRDDGVTLSNGSGPAALKLSLSHREIGHTVTADVIAEAACCEGYRAVSEPVLITGPKPIDDPYASGSLEVGATMVAQPGTWVFPTPIARYEYQWFREVRRRLVPLARTKRYRVQPADLGNHFRIRVRAVGEDGREGTWLGDRSDFVRFRPAVRLRTVREDGHLLAVVRVEFPFPRRTVGGHAAVRIVVDRGRQMTFPMRSARFIRRIPLNGPRHEVLVNASGARQTGFGGRTFLIRGGTTVPRPD